jgi:hypothetical protein
MSPNAASATSKSDLAVAVRPGEARDVLITSIGDSAERNHRHDFSEELCPSTADGPGFSHVRPGDR